ncbi:MAG TPA: type 1 glutamine amidotransferase [Stackebrandtia sp.]|jgi:GMP synthase-like glutamine amidotransferase|uniref:type 1 glutamine amidotransferase n=1 Tax=Stackebrandtia sp. TaxID=2023065 RepID=UPI002D60E8B0|nr:type 1 glutamine amidotransferase [Stackebrandtia sp.]HZE38284.1 type 1 glutamine amidotransferase [Stackebrandtia sp.]
MSPETETSPRVLVVQNDPDGGPRRLADWLTADGLRLDVVHAYRDALPDGLDHDAIVVLGGGYLPDADDRAPWLKPTRALVRQALDDARPVLGICLGGQLLAHVGGGTVTGDVGAPENGSTPITLRPKARGDRLFVDLPARIPAIEHHVDAITALPADAVWLAESPDCPYQAFRLGACAWGVQFHPEITPERVRDWDTDRLRRQGFDPDEVYAAAVIDEPESTPVWRRVAERFAAVVSQSRRAT